MKKGFIFSLAILILLVSGGFAITGSEVLDKVEATMTGPKDYEGKAEMVLANLDGSAKETRVVKMWISGKDKRLIKFLSPAGVSGIGLLAKGANEMYLYLPAMNKIRRIEGSFKSEDFQGTDFSYDELGSYEYKKDFSSVIEKEDATSYTLVLTKNANSDKNYDKMIMTVDKTTFIPKRMEMYQGGKLKKVLTILDVQKAKYITPTKIRMENVEKKHYTEFSLSEIKYDQNLENSGIFEERFLKRKER